jgi:hypothetical protein
MSKCKYNDNSLMPKTRKNARTRKDKTSKKKDLEDLIEEEDLDSETGSETGSETESETDDETDDENGTSMSKELNKMMNETIDSDLTIPAIGISLIAIIGFALYKGSKM